jgi:hypothetical protein
VRFGIRLFSLRQLQTRLRTQALISVSVDWIRLCGKNTFLIASPYSCTLCLILGNKIRVGFFLDRRRMSFRAHSGLLVLLSFISEALQSRSATCIPWRHLYTCHPQWPISLLRSLPWSHVHTLHSMPKLGHPLTSLFLLSPLHVPFKNSICIPFTLCRVSGFMWIAPKIPTNCRARKSMSVLSYTCSQKLHSSLTA